MVIRLHNVSRWAQLEPGNVFPIYGEQSRNVRFELNCETDTRLDIVRDEVPTFLATIRGREDIEFAAEGECYLVATSEGEVWYHTDEGDRIDFENPMSVSFTKIANRKARNPALEMMMFKTEQNMKRRLAALEDEAMSRIEAMGVNHDLNTGEVIEDGEDDTGAASGASGAEPVKPSGAAKQSGAGQDDSAGAAAGNAGGKQPAK